MITIRKQCMNRAAEENGSRWTAENTAMAMREMGFSVEIIDGDWGTSYHVDTEDEHQAMLQLED